MLELVGLVLEMRDTDGNIWSTDLWQEMEIDPISKLALKDVITMTDKKGWKIYHVKPYWKKAK